MNLSKNDSMILEQAAAGDETALSEIFNRYRDRLKSMVQLRLNPRLKTRVDASDVVQEAYVEAARTLAEYLAEPKIPLYLWLRQLAGQRLIMAHREHLGAQMRSAGREISLHRGALPDASSGSIAAQLMGQFSSPSQASIRAEMKLRLQEVLNRMDAVDREVLVLRHFEQLSNAETAQVLGMEPSATSKRHVRALAKLHGILSAQDAP